MKTIKTRGGKKPQLEGKKMRNEKGQFLPGVRGGPGWGHSMASKNFREALKNAVTLEDIRKIARMLIKRARRGDIRAAHELLDRLIGKAKQEVGVEVRTPEAIELKWTEVE